ncbi:MAG: hypothetical protein H5U02_01160 [Clostridia bacterium]|nr:hypothetical protein [Clostridia bacterium]
MSNTRPTLVREGKALLDEVKQPQRLGPGPQVYEEVIREIKGIIAARVKTDLRGEIAEIHAVAESGVNPKQIARDIESTLMARLGVEVDHRKISVARVQGEEPDAVHPLPIIRPRWVGMTLTVSGTSAEIRVEIALGGHVYQGQVAGLSTPRNQMRLAAVATLEAVEAYLEDPGQFVIEDIAKLVLAKQEVILVCIGRVSGRDVETLLGAAFSHGDDREAAGRATLAALNRRLALLQKGG